MMSKSLTPPNCRYIKNECFFKINHSSVYQDSLVACGYSKVPSVNILKTTLVNDIIFCILLLIHFDDLAKIVDMKTTFLYMDLKEETYMEYFQGMSDIGKDDCIILKKCIYGLVQAVRQYCKKAVEILRNSGLIRGKVIPCLYKESAKGIVYTALYLDNNLMVGDVRATDDAISAL